MDIRLPTFARPPRPTGGRAHATTVAALLTLPLILASLPAGAADPKSIAGQPGRYTMAPVDGGFVRLDSQTGTMATCRKVGADWTCEDMRDDGARLRAELDRLAAENAALKAENRRLEDTFLGTGPGPGRDGERRPDGPGDRPGDKPAFKLPSEQDVDGAFSYLQGMIKKFREKLDEIDKTHPKDNKGTPL